LNAILGFSQLLARDPSFNRTQKKHLTIINRSGEHLLDLINNVLDMSKIEAGRSTLDMTILDLHQLIADLIGMFKLRAEEKNITLTTEIAPDLPTHIETDAAKLRQILVNLLSNAIKFTEEGTVLLRCQRLQPAPDTLSCPVSHDPLPNEDSALAIAPTSTAQSPLKLLFEVEDTGHGIAANDLANIFTPFVQSETGLNTREGTGLGLPIIQKFVELLGGQMTVSSRDMTYTPGPLNPDPTPLPDQETILGSRFCFTIEAIAVNVEATQGRRSRQQVIGLADDETPRRILIVEDRWESRHLLQQILDSIGFDVRTAENGREAIAIWQDWHPELIWMDMRMPVMDGYQATKHIRAQPEGASTVIIALTASGLEDERSFILSMGCNDYVRKPFQESLILDKIAEYLGVRYEYTQIDGVEDPDTPQSIEGSIQILDNYLTKVPQDWLKRLGQAARLADNDLLAELIAERQLQEPQLAHALEHIIDNFRYDILIQATYDQTQEGS
ncbi:MAG: response regulator, partial [Cyanothece sp. SIO2G6]|nr:response regulator [Cyanothece sp. SIO2G6]